MEFCIKNYKEVINMATEEKKGFIDDSQQFIWFALLDKAQKQPEKITLEERRALRQYGFEVYFSDYTDKYEFKILRD